MGFLILQSQDQQLKYQPWQQGYLDIHHINTGRGNSTFVIFPDGTTLLIDAGDISTTHEKTLSPRNCKAVPSDSLSPGEWIVQYIKKVYPIASDKGIDYALITHFHDDHFGEVDSLRKKIDGKYLLTGITEVGTSIKIHKLIDRGFDEPVNILSDNFREKMMNDEYSIIQTLDNYKKFIEYSVKDYSLVHEKIVPGSKNQVKLKYYPSNYPEFKVTNIYANGKIWFGYGDSSFAALPLEYRGENPLSIGIKITYGNFDYFTGGDISGIDRHGQNDGASMEAQSAPIIGMVDVATLNHHGNRDSQSEVWVKSLRPSVWVQQNWSSDHPGEDVLNRILSKKLYPGVRDIYSLCMTETTKNYIGEKINQGYQSTSGHVVIRVFPGSNNYSVIVLDDLDTNLKVKNIKHYTVKF